MRAFLCAALCAAAFNAHADPSCDNPVWQTVDDFVLPGTTNASASAVLIDGNDVWVAGMSSDLTTGRWVVRRKTGNAEFVTVDDFVYTTGVRNAPSEIVPINGGVLVSGGSNNASEFGRWLVRRTTNGGASWSIVDDFTPTSMTGHAYAATPNGNGGALVTGYVKVQESYHWYTRQTSDNGTTWSTIDTFAPMTVSTAPRAITVDKSGTVFATGYNWNARQYLWQTRRRSTNGTWAVVDTWTAIPDSYGQPYGAQPTGIASGKNAGVVLAVGTAYYSDGTTHWVTRRSLDNGASWVIVDDLQGCGGSGIVFDKKDDKGFFAVGRCYVNGVNHWITRRSDPNGSNWVTEDDYLLTSTATSSPSHIDFGKGGEVYAVGAGRSGAQSRWIVRVRSCSNGALTSTAPQSLRKR